MKIEDEAFYDERAEGELRLAARAESADQRKIHLNRAAEFATMAERLVELRQPTRQA